MVNKHLDLQSENLTVSKIIKTENVSLEGSNFHCEYHSHIKIIVLQIYSYLKPQNKMRNIKMQIAPDTNNQTIKFFIAVF